MQILLILPMSNGTKNISFLRFFNANLLLALKLLPLDIAAYFVECTLYVLSFAASLLII